MECGFNMDLSIGSGGMNWIQWAQDRGLIYWYTVEIHLSGRKLSESPIIRIGLAVQVDWNVVLKWIFQ